MFGRVFAIRVSPRMGGVVPREKMALARFHNSGRSRFFLVRDRENIFGSARKNIAEFQKFLNGSVLTRFALLVPPKFRDRAIRNFLSFSEIFFRAPNLFFRNCAVCNFCSVAPVRFGWQVQSIMKSISPTPKPPAGPQMSGAIHSQIGKKRSPHFPPSRRIVR